MKCSLFVLLRIASVYALVDFKTLEINICASEENRFYVMEEKTIEQCVDECRARKHCEALNYRTEINLCELFSTTNPGNLSHGDCIYADKRNLQPFQNHCKYGEVQETTGCVIKECVNMTIPENGRVLGNMMKVGAKIRYICENGYKLKDNRYTSVAECLNTGHWSANAECVLVTYTGTIWSDWSSCNVSCCGGIRTRNSLCTIPTQNGNDVQCSQGDLDLESEICNNQTCQVNNTWATWTDWSSCSVSCGGGQKTRNRTCIVHTQNGNDVQCSPDDLDFETETCNNQTCQVTFNWTIWTVWSSCNVSCGGGQRIRTRSCTITTQNSNDLQCSPDNQDIERETCNNQTCQVTYTWTCTITAQSSDGVHCLSDDPSFEKEECNHKTCQMPTIGKSCTRDTNCVETNGTCIRLRCFCNHLYRYNVTLQNCIKACDSMTDEFEEFPGFAINYYSHLWHWETLDSTEICKNMCIDKKNCLSFEVTNAYLTYISCKLAIVSRDMMLDAFPENIIENSEATLYTRKCS